MEGNIKETRQYTYNVTQGCVGVNSVVVEKQILLNNLSVCVCVCVCVCVTLIMQHATRAVAWLAQQYFPHYHIKRTILLKIILRKTCGLIFSTTLYDNFLILSSIQRDPIKMYIGHQVRYSLFLSYFNET